MTEMYVVDAYTDEDDALAACSERFEDQLDALHQKALWEREGAATVTIEQDTDRLDAHEEGECLLCAPAPHPNCESYTVVCMLDPAAVPLGEDDGDHLVEIPVCLEHYQAFEQYQQGKNVPEVDAR